MTDFNLQFLHNEADEDEGLGHAGIETFKDSPYASTARECGQNSSDARLKKPVIINFDVLALPLEELPAAEQLESAIESCLSKARQNGKEKNIEFFDRAKSVVEQGTVKVLRIADYNTRGLSGPCKPGQPFHSLVKATGVSSKEQETSGGSFGIGKNAVFAISDLQTVFYSTIYLDEEHNEQFLAQGKSILISHEDEQGVSRRATGYWGAPDYTPMQDEDVVPDWLCRDEVGTSIFAIGFRESDGWQFRMAASLIRNFFVAIHRGEMEFTLNDGEIQITANNLLQLFQDDQIREAAKESSQLEDFEYASDLYDCLTSEESKKKILKINGMGNVLVQILVREGLPKRLSIIRNGMVITDSLEKFGDKFAIFRMYRDFVAFVEPRDDQGSTLIKRLENPRHDGLSAERISDEEKRSAYARSMRSLARRIREAIKDEVLSVPDKVQALDELAQFFADVDKHDDIPDPEADKDPEKYTYTPVKRKTKRPSVPKIRGLDTGGGDEGDVDIDSSGWQSVRDGSGAGKSGTGSRARQAPVALKDSRNRINTGFLNKRTVWFTPEDSGEVTLAILATGMNSSDLLPVSETSLGKLTEGGFVCFDAVEGQRQQLELTLSEEYDGPVEMIALRKVEEVDANAD